MNSRPYYLKMFDNFDFRPNAKELMRQELFAKNIIQPKKVITKEQYEEAVKYIEKNVDRVNRKAAQVKEKAPAIEPYSYFMLKDLDLLNGTMLEIERLLSFKIGSEQTRRTRTVLDDQGCRTEQVETET